MSKKSEKLKVKLAELSEQLAVAQRSEREADKAELLRLIDRADCLTEALAWARAKIGRRLPRHQNQREETT
jgi:hypothetical protein